MSARTMAMGRDRLVTSASFLDPEIIAAVNHIKSRTRSSLGLSTVLHAALFTWLIFLWRPEPEVPPITEITFIDPGDLTPAPPAKLGSAATSTTPGELRASNTEVQFKRGPQASELRLAAQAPGALEDLLNARRAELQGTGASKVGAAAAAPTSVWGSAPATVSGTGTGGTAPVALKRGGGEGAGPALELHRGGHGLAPALVATPAPVEKAAAPAPARSGEGTARRTLAGVTLMGPIADRAILAHVSPVYPEWAKKEAVEGSVTLYFVVRADGTVKENILVQKTAGFEEFDENARAALAAWRFEALRDGSVGEQWGNITFHFRLRGGA